MQKNSTTFFVFDSVHSNVLMSTCVGYRLAADVCVCSGATNHWSCTHHILMLGTEPTITSSISLNKQECFPVGCVPPAAAVVCWWKSASVHAGYTPPGLGLDDLPAQPPGVGLDTHQVWAWVPPGVGLDKPPARPQTSPLGMGLDTHVPSQTPQHPPLDTTTPSREQNS